MSEISVGNAPSVVTKKAGVFARAKASIKRSVAVLNTKTARTVFRCVGMPLAVFLASRGVAQADDLMTAGRKDAEETFGEGSTMMYYIMLAEVVLVFLLYLRNHNPATFLFIPVFFVVTTVIFAILDSRAGG